jgi:putative nucleotidyltransferase with HDIG domain
MRHVKTITIDQLKPGMFIVGMDQPWFRTPFLFHTRLIRHQKDIDLLRRHGIKEVTIDPRKGLDSEGDSSEEALQADRAEGNTDPLQPPLTQEEPSPLNAHIQAAAAKATYNEAICSMERMFDELEAGTVPRPDTLRMVVGNVLSRVLNNSASMLTVHFLQKTQRFDRTMASHALDICTLSLIVAHHYGVAEGDMEVLGAGALLHDIGYTRLPRNLYRRSQDLTEQERTLMQQHPALGLALLREAKEERNAVVRIVVGHHERSDGSGFPHKLKGNSLSVLAQLVGLVDIYDGMVSRRGGRPAMLQHDAIRQLLLLGDTGQYAKDLIQAMIGSLGLYPIGSLVLLNTAEQAVVVGMNPTQRLIPVVKVITGPQGGSYLTPIRIDLGAQAAGASARTIVKVLDPLDERVNVAMFLDGIHEEAA